jgi:hypothetical protein
MENKFSKKGKVVILKIFLMIIIISGLVNCAYLLYIPTDSKNAFIFSYSLNRLLFIGLISSGVFFAYFLYRNVKKKPDKSIKKAEAFFSLLYIKPLLSLFLVIVIIFCWLVPQNFKINPFYIERLQPVFIFISTIAIVLILLSYFIQDNWGLSINFTTTVVMCSVTALFLFILFLYPILNNGSWSDSASVPILAAQVIGIWLAITIMKQFNHEIFAKTPRFILKNLDKIIFIFIWVCAAFLWVNQPIEFPEGKLITFLGQHIRPLPPNYEIYPFTDSQTYFSISESIVIGQGIFRSIDKSLFLAFEGLNNWLAGGSYERMLDFQAVFLALFPSVLYLLGKEIHSRSAGLMAAVLAVLHEINGIQVMRDFPVSSSKMLLSEPFMQLWTGLIALTAVVAFKGNSKKQANLFLICGSVLGLSALFRLNTLVVIPVLLLVIIVYFFHDKNILLKNTSMFIVGIILALTPWMIHNAVKFNDPLAFVKGKEAVINQRYEKTTSQNDAQYNSYDYPSSIISISSNINSSKLLYSHTKEIDPNYQLASSILLERVKPDYFKKDAVVIPKSKARLLINFSFANSGFLDNQMYELSSKILRHFLNNIIASFSIFPTSINPQDQHFWQGYYDIDVYGGANLIILIFNLLTIAAGITAAINHQKFIGLIPLGVFFSYHLSNGLALASGNRYAQPTSWILLLYYSLGLITYSRYFIIQKKDRNILGEEFSTRFILHKNDKKQQFIFGLIVFLVLVISSTPVMADLLPVNRFPEIADELIALKMLEDLSCQEKLIDAGFTNVQDFLNLINDKGYFASVGRVLGPLQINKEEYNLLYRKAEKLIERDDILFTFYFLEPKSKNPIQMTFYPRDPNIELPNGSDAMIVSVEGTEAIVIGIIDPSYASNTISHDDLSSISFSCYLADSY